MSLRLRMLCLLILLSSVMGCLAQHQAEVDNASDTRIFLLLTIRDIYGYPCPLIRGVQSDFTAGGDHYFHVRCESLDGRTVWRYTAQHNPYAPRGTKRAWVVLRAAY